MSKADKWIVFMVAVVSIFLGLSFLAQFSPIPLGATQRGIGSILASAIIMFMLR